MFNFFVKTYSNLKILILKIWVLVDYHGWYQQVQFKTTV